MHAGGRGSVATRQHTTHAGSSGRSEPESCSRSCFSGRVLRWSAGPGKRRSCSLGKLWEAATHQAQQSLESVSRQPTAQTAVLDEETSVSVCVRPAQSDAELEAAANLRADAYYEAGVMLASDIQQEQMHRCMPSMGLRLRRIMDACSFPAHKPCGTTDRLLCCRTRYGGLGSPKTSRRGSSARSTAACCAAPRRRWAAFRRLSASWRCPRTAASPGRWTCGHPRARRTDSPKGCPRCAVIVLGHAIQGKQVESRRLSAAQSAPPCMRLTYKSRAHRHLPWSPDVQHHSGNC